MKVRLFRNWVLIMISVIIQALFSRKMSLPFKDVWVSSCCHWHQQTSIISRQASPAGLRLQRTVYTHPLLLVAMCPPSCSFFLVEEISSVFNMSTRLMKGGGHRARAKTPYSEAWLKLQSFTGKISWDEDFTPGEFGVKMFVFTSDLNMSWKS